MSHEYDKSEQKKGPASFSVILQQLSPRSLDIAYRHSRTRLLLFVFKNIVLPRRGRSSALSLFFFFFFWYSKQ